MDWSLKIPQNPIQLPLKGKYIIFSDLHRDKFRNKAGNFWYNRDIYVDALQYYLKNGYTLIENGDGEELWQFNLREIMKSHEEIYQIMADFYKKKRLFLIYGNHNIDMKFRLFHRYWTDKYMNGAKYHPMIMIGDHIIVTHGHQWDLVYKLGFIPISLLVRFWKYMEYLGFGSFDPSIPAGNPELVKSIDRRIIKWGRDYGYIMICGHTHHAKLKPEGNWYFNSGCGTVENRVTGLEISNSDISLIRWYVGRDGKNKKVTLQRTKLLLDRKSLKRDLRAQQVETKKKNVITVFGSSAPKPGEEEYETARELGSLLARNGFVLKNGGYAGTMEAGAKGTVEESGTAIGVTLASYNSGKGNRYLSRELIAVDLFDRLKKLIEESSAYVILPGSTGTLAEISLLIELINKGLVGKAPVIFLGDYWDDQIDIYRRISPRIDNLIFKETTPQGVLKVIKREMK
jgi:uncharacterized protein (TIGR00730 family)